jgi:hypothetical protein
VENELQPLRRNMMKTLFVLVAVFGFVLPASAQEIKAITTCPPYRSATVA